MLVEQKNSNDEQLTRAVLRLNGNIMGLSCGILAGLALFIATVWLVVKGGQHVGAHLRLLSQFFIGYSVTLPGSFIGLAYGFITGYAAGWVVAWIYNRIILLKNR
jgi:hypothetical protein